MDKVNEVLISARERKKFNHQQIADNAGISRSYYTNIENGNKNPSIRVALRIAGILGVTPEVLFPDVFKDMPGFFLQGNAPKRNKKRAG